jgi:hypothetical protein
MLLTCTYIYVHGTTVEHAGLFFDRRGSKSGPRAVFSSVPFVPEDMGKTGPEPGLGESWEWRMRVNPLSWVVCSPRPKRRKSRARSIRNLWTCGLGPASSPSERHRYAFRLALCHHLHSTISWTSHAYERERGREDLSEANHGLCPATATRTRLRELPKKEEPMRPR